MSRKEGSESSFQLQYVHDALQALEVLGSAASPVPHNDAAGQDALSSGSIEG